MRAAIYCRVSTDRQDEHGASLDTQEAENLKACEEHRWQVAYLFREVHTGAELFERPDMTKLRRLIRDREIDVISASWVDRLTREQHHLGLLISEADHAGVMLHFVHEEFDDSPAGKFMRAAQGYVGEIQRLKTREITMAGRAERVKRGKPLPGPRARFGYCWRDAGRTGLDIDPGTAEIVRSIFEMAGRGMPTRAIAGALNARAVPSPSGRARAWSHSTIRGILTDPVYIGDAAAYRHSERSTQQLPEGTAPAIVEQSTFEAVAERLRRNKQEASRNNRNPEAALLRGGYVRCAYCGRAMGAYIAKMEYRCFANSDTPGICPEHPQIAIPLLDRACWERITERLSDPQIIMAELLRQETEDSTEADLMSIDRAILAISRKQLSVARAVAALSDDQASAPLLIELRRLSDEKLGLEGERLALQAQYDRWGRAKGQLQELGRWYEAVAKNLATLDYGHRRMALEALAVDVRVYKASDREPRWEITAGLPTGIVGETPWTPLRNMRLRWTQPVSDITGHESVAVTPKMHQGVR